MAIGTTSRAIKVMRTRLRRAVSRAIASAIDSSYDSTTVIEGLLYLHHVRFQQTEKSDKHRQATAQNDGELCPVNAEHTAGDDSAHGGNRNGHACAEDEAVFPLPALRRQLPEALPTIEA